jgi:hypothetical protein
MNTQASALRFFFTITLGAAAVALVPLRLNSVSRSPTSYDLISGAIADHGICRRHGDILVNERVIALIQESSHWIE